MRITQKIIYILASILSLLLIFTFRTVPSGKLWKKYNVLYVSQKFSEDEVLKLLNENEIDDVTCFSSQYLPLLLNKNSPEVSLYRLKTNDSYANKRKAFFFDKSQNYRLYYIPQIYKPRLLKVQAQLLQNKIPSGIDSSGVYPLIIPLAILLFSLLLLYFSKKRIVFATGAVYCLLFSICNPFYTAAASLVLTELFIFILSNMWKREGFFPLLAEKKIFIILFAAIILNIITSSLSTAVLFLFFIIGIFSSLSIYSEIENYRNKKLPFQTLYILPARKLSFFNSKNFIILPLSILVILAFLAISMLSSFSTGLNPVQGSSKVILPAKSSSKDTELAQFDDYYKWKWSILTAPYKSLNDEEGNKDEVTFPYYEEENNKIIKKTKTFIFDRNFCSSTFSQIDDLSFNAIEKVLKSEGETSSFGYVSMNAYSVNPYGTITIFICFFILLFIYISSIIKKGGNR